MVFDGAESRVERAEQLRQASFGDAFVVMGVPAVERERADARAVGLRQKFCGGAGGFGEIGARVRRTRAARLLRHSPDMLDRGQLDVVVERAPRVFDRSADKGRAGVERCRRSPA